MPNYRVIKPLSSGGMAEVILAEAVNKDGSKKKVVLKRIPQHLAANSEFVRIFLEEGRLAGMLRHPNIAEVLDAGRDEGGPFIAAEFIDGATLRGVLEHPEAMARLDLEVACRIGFLVCEALSCAHGFKGPEGPQELVHRDVSPENIMISVGGAVKVLDFGIARANTNEIRAQAGLGRGKVFYLSPEQVRGEPLDSRSDVFSLSVVLFELFTGGQRPHTGATQSAIMKSITSEPPVPLLQARPDLPKALAMVVARGLKKSPDERYPTAKELGAELDKVLRDRSAAVPSRRISPLANLALGRALPEAPPAVVSPDGEGATEIGVALANGPRTEDGMAPVDEEAGMKTDFAMPAFKLPTATPPEDLSGMKTDFARKAFNPDQTISPYNDPATLNEDLPKLPEPGPGPTTTDPEMPALVIPAAAMPAAAMPVTAMSAAAMPATAMPATAMPVTAMPVTAMPVTAMPATAMPVTAMPATEVPLATVPSAPLPVITAKAPPAAPARPSPRKQDPQRTMPLPSGPPPRKVLPKLEEDEEDEPTSTTQPPSGRRDADEDAPPQYEEQFTAPLDGEAGEQEEAGPSVFDALFADKQKVTYAAIGGGVLVVGALAYGLFAPTAKAPPEKLPVPTAPLVKRVDRAPPPPVAPAGPDAGSADAGPPAPVEVGSIWVDSTPPCQVSLDGAPKGKTPVELKKVPVGFHTLVFENEALGVNRTVDAEARANQRTQSIQRFGKGTVIISGFDGTKVFCNGKLLGVLPMKPLKVYEGVMDFELERNGKKLERHVELQVGAKYDVMGFIK